MEESNPILKDLGVGNQESFWKRTKGLGQHDSVKLKISSGATRIDITGSQGQSPDDIPDQTGINNWDDEFEGTSLDTSGTRRSGAEAWTWYNQGSSTLIQANGRSVMQIQATLGGDEKRAIMQDAPSTPWTFRCKVKYSWVPERNNYQMAGMICYNASTDDWSALAMGSHSGGGYPGGGMFFIYGSSGLSGSYSIGPYMAADQMEPCYFEFENDGTTLYARASFSGVDGTFVEYGSNLLSSHIGQVDRLGLFSFSSNNQENQVTFEWWRRIA